MSKTPKDQNIKTLIYTLADPDTLAVRYVGKTSLSIKRRLKLHLDSPKRETNYRTNWIKSILNKDKIPLLEIIDECKWKDSQKLEIYWISQFKTWGFKLVNLTDGGEGNLGRPRSEKSKLKSSMSNSKKVYQYDLDGNFIKEWYGCTIAGKSFGKSNSKICACARKVRMSAYGFLWSYEKLEKMEKHDRSKNTRGVKQSKGHRDKTIKNLKGYGKYFI